MTFYVENETMHSFDFDVEKTVEKVIVAALDYCKCPYEAEVSVLITDNEGIREINNEHREIDKATDVLSFPNIEYEQAGDFSHLEEVDLVSSCFHPESGELMLGDIVVSYEKVISQAEEFGHSQLREFSFLIVHSMLHLLGYDHMDEEDAAIMEPKQEAILNSLNITRE